MTEGSLFDFGPIVEGLTRDLGISIETMAAALEVDRRTVERWRANQSIPHGKTRESLRELMELRDRILRSFESAEAARGWIHARSRYLGDFTPEEALKAGRLDRVRADLDGLASGVHV